MWTHSQAKAQPQAKAERRSSLPRRDVMPIVSEHAHVRTCSEDSETDILCDERLPVDELFTFCELGHFANSESKECPQDHT
jgi:hypothetical protein